MACPWLSRVPCEEVETEHVHASPDERADGGFAARCGPIVATIFVRRMKTGLL